MKYIRKKRKIIRATNAIDGATTRPCWGKKVHGYLGVAGKGGGTTNNFIPDAVFARELKEFKEGSMNA